MAVFKVENNQKFRRKTKDKKIKQLESELTERDKRIESLEDKLALILERLNNEGKWFPLNSISYKLDIKELKHKTLDELCNLIIDIQVEEFKREKLFQDKIKILNELILQLNKVLEGEI